MLCKMLLQASYCTYVQRAAHAGMDHLQSQRLEVAKAIKEEEAERVRIEQDMAVLQSRLAHIKESLQKKVNIPVALALCSTAQPCSL